MKRVMTVVAIVFYIGMIVLVTVGTLNYFYPEKPIDYATSVLPLIGVEKSNTFCTTFSINEREGLWVTAKHCTLGDEGSLTPPPFTVDYAYAEVVYRDPHWDVAVIQSTLHRPGIPLARSPLVLNDAVVVYGYPQGLAVGVLTHGFVAALNEPLEGSSFTHMLDITVAGGNSGSPVLREGQVVGVLWGRFNESMHSMSTPDDALRRVLKPFVE